MPVTYRESPRRLTRSGTQQAPRISCQLWQEDPQCVCVDAVDCCPPAGRIFLIDEAARGKLSVAVAHERLRVAGVAGGLQDAAHAEDSEHDVSLSLVALDHLEAGDSLGSGGINRQLAQLVNELLTEADIRRGWLHAWRSGELLQVEGDVLDVIGAYPAPFEPLEAQHVEILWSDGCRAILAASRTPPVSRHFLVRMLGQESSDRV